MIDGPWELTEQQIAGDQFRRSVIRSSTSSSTTSCWRPPTVARPCPECRVVHLPAHPSWLGRRGADQDVSDAAKMDRRNEIIRQVCRAPHVVLDLAGHVASIPGADTVRPCAPTAALLPDAAAEMAAWFGPQIVAAARR